MLKPNYETRRAHACAPAHPVKLSPSTDRDAARKDRAELLGPRPHMRTFTMAFALVDAAAEVASWDTVGVPHVRALAQTIMDCASRIARA